MRDKKEIPTTFSRITEMPGLAGMEWKMEAPYFGEFRQFSHIQSVHILSNIPHFVPVNLLHSKTPSFDLYGFAK